jgi:hypothetical protein
MAINPAQSAYNESAPARFPMNLRSASRELGISQQRLSRVIKFLQIPVTRLGYALLLDYDGFVQVKRALRDGVMKPGRKKKAN